MPILRPNRQQGIYAPRFKAVRAFLLPSFCFWLAVGLCTPHLRAQSPDLKGWMVDLLTVRKALGDEWLGLTTSQYQRVLEGETLFMLQSPDGGRTLEALTAKRVALSAQGLWMGATDEGRHLGVFDGVTQSLILGHLGKERLIFKQYQAPIPLVAPRYWVVESQSKGALHAQSQGRIWQVEYREHGAAQSRIQGAMASGQIKASSLEALGEWVDRCHSSWTFLALPNGEAIIEYRASSSSGDGLPRNLREMALERAHRGVVEALEAWVATGNGMVPPNTTHSPIYDPQGQPLRLP